MLQTVLNTVFSIFACGVALMALIWCSSQKFIGNLMTCSLCCLAARTPALNAFLMFVLHAVVISLSVVCCLKRISNSAIITLDIIYFISIMILVFYHTLKESRSLLVKAV
ncbi:MAG: hypothetical protein N3I35_01785 [Clostridia bacterium]|nr:hypothetical protein [Clostridia bacterium]